MTVVGYNDKLVHLDSGDILTISEIMERDRTLSIPVGITAEAMLNSGYALIFPTEPPLGDVVTLGAPVPRGDGYYEQTWEVRDFTPEELEENFQSRKLTMLDDVLNLRTTAMAAGAPIDFGGSIGLQHFALGAGNRTDYQTLKARAQRWIDAGNNTSISRTRSIEGTSISMLPQQCVTFCTAVEDQYFDLWSQAADLSDEIDMAVDDSELPALPEAITVPARSVA